MPRNKPILDSDQVSILTTRVFLSRSLGLFSLRELTVNWEISLATLHRYKSPAYREASREYRRKQYLSLRKSLQRGVCAFCQEDLTPHERCLDCTCLMHNGQARCNACVDSRIRKKLRQYQLLDQLYGD